MSMDDPGWDSPDFGDDSDGAAWSEPASPAAGGSGSSGGSGGPGGVGSGGGSGGGGKPPWEQPRILLVAGGVLALVIVVLLILVLTKGGGSEGTPAADVTTPPVATPTLAVTTDTPTPETHTSSPHVTTPTVRTVQNFDHDADSVCRAYKSRLKETEKVAGKTDDFSPFIKEAKAEFSALRRVKLPSENTKDVKTWYKKIDLALRDLEARNGPAFSESILSADTYAGELGMHICNYGH